MEAKSIWQKKDLLLVTSKLRRMSAEKSPLTKVQTENASPKSKLSGISQNADASINNLELLKRISALEKALAKAGINPNTIL